eukprot:4029548-Prymnesium_polylepis.1
MSAGKFARHACATAQRDRGAKSRSCRNGRCGALSGSNAPLRRGEVAMGGGADQAARRTPDGPLV